MNNSLTIKIMGSNVLKVYFDNVTSKFFKKLFTSTLQTLQFQLKKPPQGNILNASLRFQIFETLPGKHARTPVVYLIEYNHPVLLCTEDV